MKAPEFYWWVFWLVTSALVHAGLAAFGLGAFMLRLWMINTGDGNE